MLSALKRVAKTAPTPLIFGDFQSAGQNNSNFQRAMLRAMPGDKHISVFVFKIFKN